MGRKKVKDLRTKELLDAFEVCIARQGFNNVTLADIARQADIQRPAIRHFVGNRDELRQALARRYVAQAKQQVRAVEQLTKPLNLNSKTVIASLLTDAIMTDEYRFLALSNLFILAKDDEKINHILKEWVSVYSECLVKLIGQNYKVTKAKLNEIAHGIVTTCVGLAAVSCVDQDHYSQLVSGSIAQQLSAFKPK